MRIVVRYQAAKLTHRQERVFESVSIVLVGKYTSLEDSYMSVVKSLEHASMRCGRKLILHVRRDFSVMWGPADL